MGCLFSTGPGKVRYTQDGATGTLVVRMMQQQRYSSVAKSNLDKAKEEREEQEAEEDLTPTEVRNKRYLKQLEATKAQLADQRITVARDKELLVQAENDLNLTERRVALCLRQVVAAKKANDTKKERSARASLTAALLAKRTALGKKAQQQSLVDKGDALLTQYERVLQTEDLTARAAEMATSLASLKKARRYEASDAIDALHEHADDAAEIEDDFKSILGSNQDYLSTMAGDLVDTDIDLSQEADELILAAMGSDVPADDEAEDDDLEELLDAPKTVVQVMEQPSKRLEEEDESDRIIATINI